MAVVGFGELWSVVVRLAGVVGAASAGRGYCVAPVEADVSFPLHAIVCNTWNRVDTGDPLHTWQKCVFPSKL
jgi:hypothetical protein